MADDAQHHLLIVSDLHLAEGWDACQCRLSRLEDFLHDESFARFLAHHEALRRQPCYGGRPWRLIINGDVVDFLQVVSMPEEGDPLQALKGVRRYDELSWNERHYGLGTTAEETAWKVGRIAQGHPAFYAALGRFVAAGNSVTIVHGNHDMDWFWPQAQQRFAEEVRAAWERQRIREGLEQEPELTSEDARARITFAPWFYYEPGRVYVEHGGQYEPASRLADPLNPVLPTDPQRLDLPWGNLMVRYLFNEIEDIHPFADNVKPMTRYFWWAFRTDPLKMLEVLFTRGYVFVLALAKTTRKRFVTALARAQSAAPALPPDTPRDAGGGQLPQAVLEELAHLSRTNAAAFFKESVRWSLRQIVGALILGLSAASLLAAVWLLLTGHALWSLPFLGLALLTLVAQRFVSRRLMRLLHGLYLVEVAHSLQRILKAAGGARYLVFGHDHRAWTEPLADGDWYVNCGTWVSIYQEDGLIKQDGLLSFFRLPAGHTAAPDLLYWDDGAGEPRRIPLRAPGLVD